MKRSDALRERVGKALHERHALQRFVSRRLFRPIEAAGVHLVGDHFYEPIPNLRDIERTYSDEPRQCLGIDFEFDRADSLATGLIARWGHEFPAAAMRFGYRERNYYYRGVDAILLYAYLREFRPTNVVEIGQGMSTTIILAALDGNARDGAASPSLLTVDPYNRLQRDTPVPRSVAFRAIEKPVQALNRGDRADVLTADLLFVDSSHVYKFGSDVRVLTDEVYPAIGAGATVHIHDIFTPFEYPKDWYLDQKRFWDEAHHLENFLRFNSEFEIALPVNYLVRCSDNLRLACRTTCRYDGFKYMGASFYIRRVARDRLADG